MTQATQRKCSLFLPLPSSVQLSMWVCISWFSLLDKGSSHKGWWHNIKLQLCCPVLDLKTCGHTFIQRAEMLFLHVVFGSCLQFCLFTLYYPSQKIQFKGQAPRLGWTGISERCYRVVALWASSPHWCCLPSHTLDIKLIIFWVNPFTARGMQTRTVPASAWWMEIHFVVISFS